jgi:signal transduction histidine kinase
MAVLAGRAGDDRFTGEQAALRRVATLVARGAPPEQVLTAVTEEAGRLLGADHATMNRFGPDRSITVVAAWSSTGAAFPVGTRWSIGGRNVCMLVFQTCRAARIDDYDDASGRIAEAARRIGLRAIVGVPVNVEGRLWGVMAVGSQAGPLPPGTEAQLAGFTELAATAIANAQARVELREFVEEQAALRRVATLVAGAAAPEEVLTAVAEEVGRLLGADYTAMSRYDPDGARTVVASWSSSTGPAFPVGNRARLGGRNVATLVFETGRAARIDEHSDASGPIAEAVREFGIRGGVGVPVSVEGRLWGVMAVGSLAGPLPPGTEAQLAGFTELTATAIANAQARVELREFAEEQAALRRVATLVAGAAPTEEVLTAITEEASRLLHADYSTMNRFGPDGSITVVAAWSSTSAAFHAGTRWSIGGQNVNTLVFQTCRAARIDDYAEASGPASEDARRIGLHAGVGAPISVEGRSWGCMFVASRSEPLPAGTEAQLAGFTELAATAIANAEAQDALTASRARIVAACDATRRRIERNLHDGAQQRLVSLALDLRAAEAALAAGTGGVAQVGEVAAGMDDVLGELREIAHGLHPAILADGGLAPALKTLARRSAIPAHLDIQIEGRLPEPVEIAAYYTVAEALTNAAKHACATTADVQVTADERSLHLRIRDNGRGGADFSHGSGLVGLKDRAEALGGHLDLHSPPRAGTTLEITLPIDNPALPGLPPEAVGPAEDPGCGLAAGPGQRLGQPEAARPTEPDSSAPDRGVRRRGDQQPPPAPHRSSMPTGWRRFRRWARGARPPWR